MSKEWLKMSDTPSRPAMPEINREICTLCGQCVASCPHGAASLVAGQIVLDEDACDYCGDCEEICPVGAIGLPYDIILPHQDASGG